jgi:RNA polymerase sigma-70 factor, ECF subfamily
MSPTSTPPAAATRQRPDAHSDGGADFDLMAQVVAGDRLAWRALFERHKDFVFSIAYRFMGDEHDARDVLQDVFVALFAQASRYKPTGAFRSYLWRLVANRCLNERARAHRRLQTDLGEQLAALPDTENKEPHRLLEARETTEAVRAAILALPERQRFAVILSRYEGSSYEEIAEALSCSVSSVESLLFRARQSLAKSLAGI